MKQCGKWRAGIGAWVLVGGLLGAPGVRGEMPSLPAWSVTVPLSFERNMGQTDSRVAFLTHGPGYLLYLTPAEAVVAISSAPSSKSASEPRSIAAAVRMEWVGGNPQPTLRGLDPLPGRANYFLDRDPRHWYTGIPTYARVQYDGIYPGIDLVYRSHDRALEYDFIVAPKADPAQIVLRFHGATAVEIDQAGDLILHLPSPFGTVRHHRPSLYQDIGRRRVLVEGRYVKTGPADVRFRIGAYDKHRPLIIDPALSYSTYLGGSSDEFGSGIAVDGSGNVYATGQTNSANFPITSGAYQTTGGGVWVTKLNPTGTALLYSTFIGNGIGRAIAVAANGQASITGEAFSDFPVTSGAYQTTFGGGISDVFVAKLADDGSALVYSTFLGGFSVTAPERESGLGLAIDASGNAYVTGRTSSGPDFVPNTGAGKFPVVNAFQSERSGRSDAFVSKLNATGSSLLYSTYVGGTGLDEAHAIAVDASGLVYVTGQVASSDFPTTSGVFQTARQGGSDAFVAKFDPTASGTGSLIYSTYFGGGGSTQTFNHEAGNGIAVNAGGAVFVTGSTSSFDLPVTAGAAQLDGDAFAVKFNGTATGLLYCTYLDMGLSLALNGNDEVYVTGAGVSIDKLSADGTTLLYHVPLGTGVGRAIALDQHSNPYVTGETSSAAFPTTTGSAQAVYGGGSTDAFIAKIDESLVTVGPVNIWVGLKNSDDVGIKFDLKAQLYRNGTDLLAEKELTSVAGGSSGFNNAKLRTFTLPAVPAGSLQSGALLSVTLLIRNACTGSGKNSGTARLWYNDAAANSRFEESVNVPMTHYLLTGFLLGDMPGTGPKATVDVAAGSKCSAYKTFGTWGSVTVP